MGFIGKVQITKCWCFFGCLDKSSSRSNAYWWIANGDSIMQGRVTTPQSTSPVSSIRHATSLQVRQAHMQITNMPLEATAVTRTLKAQPRVRVVTAGKQAVYVQSEASMNFITAEKNSALFTLCSPSSIKTHVLLECDSLDCYCCCAELKAKKPACFT